MQVHFKVNGRAAAFDVEPRKTLADALREDCGLTGTHLGCEHGVCGACTVILNGQPIRSCLLFAVQCENHEVTTIEGLAPVGRFHPVQKAFAEQRALQCGFCTPGFIILVAAALEQNPERSDHEMRELLSSNLCRCTGYQSILAAAKQAAAEMAPPLAATSSTLSSRTRSN